MRMELRKNYKRYWESHPFYIVPIFDTERCSFRFHVYKICQKKDENAELAPDEFNTPYIKFLFNFSTFEEAKGYITGYKSASANIPKT